MRTLAAILFLISFDSALASGPVMTAEEPRIEGNRVVFRGTCEKTGRLILGGAGEGVVFCNRGSWEFFVQPKASKQALVYTLTAIDRAGNRTSNSLQLKMKTRDVAIAE